MSEGFDPYLQWLGIRDPERPPNAYRLLGLELFEPDADIIANAADRQMSHVRSFAIGPRREECQTLLNELAAARIKLLNAAKKSKYDEELAQAIGYKDEPAQEPAPLLVAEPLAAIVESPAPYFDIRTPPRRPVNRQQKAKAPFVPLAIAGIAVLIAVVVGIKLKSAAVAVAPPTTDHSQQSRRPVDRVKPAKKAPAIDDYPDNTPAAPEAALIEPTRPLEAPEPASPPESQPTAPAPAAPSPHPSNAQPDEPPAEESLPDLIERIEPAVLRMNILTSDGGGTGSGYLVDDRGTVATNYHVVEHAASGSAETSDGTTYRIEGVLYMEPGKDIAFVRLQAPYPKVAIKIAGQLPRKGEGVIAFGAPKGFGFTTSDGIVSAIRPGKEIAELAPSMGYDVDSWWVQLTAPISPGNSGGPLVNLKGEVIGMNTWCRIDGQNLNFAISCVDIAAAAAKVGNKVTPFHAVPRFRPPAPGNPTPQATPPILAQGGRSFGRIELPSGAFLSDDTVSFPGERVKELFDGNPTAMVGKDDKGRVRLLVCQKRGILHGPVVSFYEDEKPQTVGSYDSAKRQGEFRIWLPSGQRQLFATYKRDKKHGLYCVFQDDLPYLIVESDLGDVTGIHLVAFTNGQHELTSFDSLDTANKDEKAKVALAELASLDSTLEAGETALRQQTRKMYADFHEMEVRIVRAKTHDARRAAQRNRDAQISAMGNAVHDAVSAAVTRMHGS